MKAIEKKARQIVKEEYFNYKLTHKFYSDYATKMEMLKELFPKTTNQENLERTWDAQWKKEH